MRSHIGLNELTPAEKMEIQLGLKHMRRLDQIGLHLPKVNE